MTLTVDPGATPPGLARRFAAFLYDGALLFGVLFSAGLLTSIVVGRQDALRGTAGLAFLLIGLGAYFVYFWTRSGQTLAMKTWHLRVVDGAGQPLGLGRAVARYLLSWLWFLPALITVKVMHLHGAAILGSLVAGIAGYLLVARLHPQRQFLHDAICGSRIITQLPVRS
ncbi:RDD family protein [Roseateles sp. BYS96W]|uniref:RDD family protein n=1 Tax=Pelomonas nitida TaxID=3299027 RepID=A0ABW7G923_9BURK